jgi:hypothetical protein
MQPYVYQSTRTNERVDALCVYGLSMVLYVTTVAIIPLIRYPRLDTSPLQPISPSRRRAVSLAPFVPQFLCWVEGMGFCSHQKLCTTDVSDASKGGRQGKNTLKTPICRRWPQFLAWSVPNSSGHASVQREFGTSILPIGAQTCYSLGCYDDYTLPSAKL